MRETQIDHKPDWQEEQKQNRQPPAWRASDGRLREHRPVGKKLPGYIASRAEQRSGKAPKPLAELRNSYGRVASGANGRELTLMVSRTRTRGGRSLPQAAKELDARRAVRVRPARGVYLTGNLDPRGSAFAYRAQLKTSPFLMARKLKGMVARGRYKALEQMLPFLSTRKERAALRELAALEREYSETGRVTPAGLQTRKVELRAGMEHKRREEHAFNRHLRKSVEKARRVRMPVRGPFFFTSAGTPGADAPTGPGEGNGAPGGDAETNDISE